MSQQGFNPFTHCHDATWKRPVKVQNLKPLNLFVVFFALACQRIFTKTDIIESSCVIGSENLLFASENLLFASENLLFASASVHLSARKLYRLGRWRGLQTTATMENQNQNHYHLIARPRNWPTDRPDRAKTKKRPAKNTDQLTACKTWKWANTTGRSGGKK